MLAALPDDADLHVLGTTVDDLQEGLDCEPNTLLLLHAILVVLLEKLPERLGVPAPDNLGLPAGVGPGRIGLVEDRVGLLALTGGVGEAGDEGGDSEGTDATPLSVLLLSPRDVAGQVLDRGGVLACETVGLGLSAGLIDEDAGVCGKAGEGQDRAIVDGDDLADRSGILQPAEGLGTSNAMV